MGTNGQYMRLALSYIVLLGLMGEYCQVVKDAGTEKINLDVDFSSNEWNVNPELNCFAGSNPVLAHHMAW